MISEIIEPLAGGEVEIAVFCAPEDAVPDAAQVEPVIFRNPGVLYGLANLIDNAADFARNRVAVSARWGVERIAISIEDDGSGIALDVIDKLGEPYVTTREGARSADLGEDSFHDGMGLGFFIAKTLLERSGATIDIANRPRPDQGAVVTVVWPRADLDVGGQWRAAAQ